MSYDRQVQERIAGALERIEALLRGAQAAPAESRPADGVVIPINAPKRRGRPPKVRNG